MTKNIAATACGNAAASNRRVAMFEFLIQFQTGDEAPLEACH